MSQPALDLRVLVLAPIGKDAALIEAILQHERVACTTCADLGHLGAELRRGAGALVLTEEALPEGDAALSGLIGLQPPWSDLPVLVLARSGASSRLAIDVVDVLGNVTLLERPVRVSSLISAVRSALRARERQYQIRAHLEERDRADRRKDEFLAMLAHELRNPLAPIRSCVDLLRLQAQQPPAPEQLATMDRQVTHMMRLVDDLMDVSRVTRGQIQTRLEPVLLHDIIEAAVAISRPQLDAAGHRFTQALPAEPVVVEADSVRLTQVFSNLLNNAAKYTDAGGNIRLEAAVDGDVVEVMVSDNGLGIPPDVLPHLFNMFFQGERRERGGLGVGLTLARSIVQLHRGSIGAHSDGPGRGSTFTVRLPVSRRPVAGPPRRGELQRGPRGAPRLLVVDDNRDAASSLALLLRQLGAEVRVANDGPAALQAIGTFRPDAMFLDIGMPGMDGYEVAGRVRALNDRAPVLIALTGWGQDGDRRRSAEAGFAHHLVKPADAGRLRDVLASLPASSR